MGALRRSPRAAAGGHPAASLPAMCAGSIGRMASPIPSEDPTGLKRPWQLDLLPLIIDAGRWDSLSEALAQRHPEPDLADLYGPQQSSPTRFRRADLRTARLQVACRGIVPPGGIFLHHHAADLARAPDGRWWVMADRTQGPLRAGYALQNRIILSRAFPTLSRVAGADPGEFLSCQSGHPVATRADRGGEARWRSC